MDTIIIIACFVVGIFSLILLIKVWIMCNDVRDIKEILEKSNKGRLYDYLHNNSIETLQAEAAAIEELIYCGKIQEARDNQTRLKYHIMKKEKRHEQFGNDVNYYMQDERRVMERIEGLFKS